MEPGIKTKKDLVIITVNPKVYALETVYSAAYVFLDKAYILLDGDPKKEIIVKLISKTKADLKKLGLEFYNELINYSDYKKRAEQTKVIREIILQRALISNDPSLADTQNDEKFDDLMNELDTDYLDDPEGIAIPWEEKYGKKKPIKKAAKKKVRE